MFLHSLVKSSFYMHNNISNAAKSYSLIDSVYIQQALLLT